MKQMTKTKEAEWRGDWQEFNRLRRSNGRPKITFEHYIKRRTGKVKRSAKSVNEIPTYTYPGQERKHKSLETDKGNTAKQDPTKYSGKKLIGIGTMHKSNMVPIFSKDEADDIGKMRRG